MMTGVRTTRTAAADVTEMTNIGAFHSSMSGRVRGPIITERIAATRFTSAIARRKAEKNPRKAWGDRHYDNERFYDNDRYYSRDRYSNYDPIYRSVYYSYSTNRWEDWRDGLLRSVIGSVFNQDGGYDTYQSYAPQSGYRQVYQPSYYGGQDYSPYVDDRYQYSTAYADNPYYSDDVVNNLGFGGSDFGGIVSRIFTELLAVGYNDGIEAGRYARSLGYRDDQNYYDPYDPNVYSDVSFDNVDYNPYSCRAENRRYLSEGYELGYQDGLRDADGRSGLDGGAVDLVSMLLGNVL